MLFRSLIPIFQVKHVYGNTHRVPVGAFKRSGAIARASPDVKVSPYTKVTPTQVQTALDHHRREEAARSGNGGQQRSQPRVARPELPPQQDPTPEAKPKGKSKSKHRPKRKSDHRSSSSLSFTREEAEALLHDIDTQWGALPEGGALLGYGSGED